MAKQIQMVDYNNSEMAEDGAAKIVDQFNLQGYSEYLNKHALEFSCRCPYLLVGDIPEGQQWLVHISVVKQQFHLLADNLIVYLKETGLSFAMAESPAALSMLLDGRCGFANLAKIFTVVLPGNENIYAIMNCLLRLTESFLGPEIRTAIKVGACTYISYGYPLPKSDLNLGYQDVGTAAGRKFFRKILAMNKVSWPFEQYASLQFPQKSDLYKRRFLQIQVLKEDSKGAVTKCIKLNQFYNMQWVVVKQAKRYQCYDDFGRDATDRLLWQRELYFRMKDGGFLPAILDLFQIGDDLYLAFEYLNGTSVAETVNQISGNMRWKCLCLTSKLEILELVSKVTALLADFHRNGIIHRDLNPANFIVRRDGKLFAIDLELCFDVNCSLPSPAFISGTPGYMSPGQRNQVTPVTADDIYGLGALMLRIFTELSPIKFDTNDLRRLKEGLFYFTGDNLLADMICSCLGNQARLRPPLPEIQKKLELITNRLRAGEDETVSSQSYSVKEQINRGLLGLGALARLRTDHLWTAKMGMENRLLANEVKMQEWSPTFENGTAGILFTIAFAKSRQYDTSNIAEVRRLNYRFLRAHYSSGFSGDRAGLYNGAAGFVLFNSVFPGLNTEDAENGKCEFISRYLLLPNDNLNIADGVAGQGLVLLYMLKTQSSAELGTWLRFIVAKLLEAQKQDGAWMIKRVGHADKMKLPGFAYGIAGIAFFLLEYGRAYNDKYVLNAALKALDWLINRRKLLNGKEVWTAGNNPDLIDPWLEYGSSGIALAFIKAHEVFGQTKFKAVATDALKLNPPQLVSNALGLGNGLAGLGLVYLEAFRVFKEKEWIDRAEHITVLLGHTCRTVSGDGIAWVEGNETGFRPGLMDGSCGILFFLMYFEQLTISKV